MASFRTYDGLRLFAAETGGGAALLVLGGGPGMDVRYLGDLAGIGARRRVIRMDARAAGRSEVPHDRATVSFAEQARDVEALREHLALDRFDLLAHSAGCLTAQEYAARYPGRVGRLVLVTPVGRAARETDPAEIKALRAARRDEPWYPEAAAAEKALAAGGLTPNRQVILQSRLLPFYWHRWTPQHRGEHVPAHASRLPWLREAFYAGSAGAFSGESAAAAMPVLVIAGASDGMIGTAPARAVAACHPGSRLEVMAASGHRPWVEEPDRFRILVDEFLDT